MAKKSRPSPQPNPAIRLSGLPVRLSQLFAGGAADGPALFAELDRLTEGLKPGSFLPLVVGAVYDAPEARRAGLAPLVGEWLRERGLLGALGELEARSMSQNPARGLARGWLEAGGIAPSDEVALDPAELFLDAYELGEPSQDSPTLFWYEDARRRKVCSAAFLVDFEPPWDGAVKDLAFRRHRDPVEATDRFLGLWRSRGVEPRPMDAETASQRVWAALRQNQARGIRLPADFVAAMPQILPFLLALPASPEAPPLSADEVEAMAREGRSPESIRQEEQLLGYQTRMPDGKVIRIMRPPDDEL